MKTAKHYSILSRGGLQSQSVNVEKRLILGFAVASKGPAAGHGEMIDDETLDQIVKLGNSANEKTGVIRARMDHPLAGGTIENSLDQMLGRPVNFRRDGDVVRADLQLMSSAAAPLGDKLLAMAIEAPELFGASMVFDYINPKEHMRAVADGKNPPVRIRNIYAVDFVDLPATNPQGLFAAGENKEPAMAKLAAFVRNGALMCHVDGTEYEIELPNEAKPKDEPKGKEGAEEPDGDEAGKQAAKHSAVPVDAEKIKADAIKAEREYAQSFRTCMDAAGLKGKDADEFHAAFYGRAMEDVKFLASKAIGARTQPVGEGAGEQKPKTDAELAEEKEVEADKIISQRWAADSDLRKLHGVNTSDAKDPQYQARLARLIKAERKCRADEKAGRFVVNPNGSDK